MDQPRPLFVYFRPWQSPFYRWSCRLQQHSNSDRRSRRGARWPLDHGPLSSLLSCWKSPSFFLCLHFFRTSFKRMSFKFYFAHHVIMLSFRVMHEPAFLDLFIIVLNWALPHPGLLYHLLCLCSWKDGSGIRTHDIAVSRSVEDPPMWNRQLVSKYLSWSATCPCMMYTLGHWKSCKRCSLISGQVDLSNKALCIN